MPPLHARLRLLVGLDPASAAAILAGAIPHARPGEVEAICRAAVATGRRQALIEVIRHLHRLGPAGPGILAAGGDSVDRALGAVLDRGDAQSTLNGIEAAARRPGARLAEHLARLLDDPREEIPPRAARALLEITVAATDGGARRPGPGCDHERLDRGLALACRRYREHRLEDAILAAALLAGRPGPALHAALADEDQPVLAAVRGVAERVEEPIVRRNLIRWLGTESLGRASARWLHRIEGREAYLDLLADGHLLLAPSRRRVLARADRPLRCPPSIAIAAGLAPRIQARVPVMVGRLDLSPRARVGLLADMIALPSPLARVRALEFLLTQPPARSAPFVQRLCFDRSVEVARQAVREVLAGPEGPSEALLARLEESPHAPIAGTARRCLARSATGAFIARWRALPDAERRAAAVTLAARDREPFTAGLRGMLRLGSEEEQAEAIRLVRRLRLVPAVEEVLLHLVRTGSARIASAAVAALAAGKERGRVRVLARALDHGDDRVRANAIEALSVIVRRGEGAPASAAEAVARHARSRHNRCRANAVRALVGTDRERGVENLRAMLRDEDPLHRVSGIWVARSARVVETGPDLEQLAAAERRPVIRGRAEAARRWLEFAPPAAQSLEVRA